MLSSAFVRLAVLNTDKEIHYRYRKGQREGQLKYWLHYTCCNLHHNLGVETPSEH